MSPESETSGHTRGADLEICFEQVAETASAAVAVFDSERGVVLWSNAAFRSLCETATGRVQQDGCSVADLFGDAGRSIAAAIGSVAHGESSQRRSVTWLVGPGGAPTAWRWSVTPLPAGDRVDAVLVVDDVTEHISALLEAELAADRFRAVAEGAADIILLLTEDGTVVEANGAAVAAYGRSRDELLGMNMSQLRDPDTLEEMPEQLDAARSAGALYETVHLRVSGETFPVEVSSRPVSVGGQTMLLSIVRDISTRRRREAERERILGELERANTRLDGLLKIITSAVGSLDSDELVEDVLPVVREVLDADAALYFAVHDTHLELRRSDGLDGLVPAGMRLGIEEGFAGQVAATATPLYERDVSSTGFALPLHKAGDIRSMLGVPVLVGDSVTAVVEVLWTEERSIDPSSLPMLQAAADKLGVAMASARRYERIERTDELGNLVNRLSVLITSSLDLDETMDEALRLACEGLDCDLAMIGAVNDGSWTIHFSHGADKTTHLVPFDHPGEGARPDVVRPLLFEPGTPSADWLRETFDATRAIGLPLRTGGEFVGALIFGRGRADEPFDDAEIEFVDRFGLMVAAALGNVRAFEAEHRVAETLQEALLAMPDSVPGLSMGHLYRSATLAARVGGDFYDAFELSDGRVGVIIGDVSGKGLDAAVATSLIKNTLRAFAFEFGSPAAAVARANEVACATLPSTDFASALLLLLEPETGSATYCCAGHPPGLVVRPTGEVRVLEVGSPVIGALERLPYEDRTFRLEPDEKLVLYTDGVTEARGPAGFFGEARLIEAVSHLADAPVWELPDLLVERVREFTGGGLTDDVAILALRRS